MTNIRLEITPTMLQAIDDAIHALRDQVHRSKCEQSEEALFGLLAVVGKFEDAKREAEALHQMQSDGKAS